MTRTQSFETHYVKSRIKKMRVHSNRLGKLCILWSNLEMDIALLLNRFFKIRDSATNNTVLGLMDFREKTKAALAVCFAKRPSDHWYDLLSATLNTIDNELRLERNRMVHDFWSTMVDGEVQRAKFNPRIVKVQSRTKKLVLADFKPITPKDISKLCSKIENASISILELAHAYDVWTASPEKSKQQDHSQNQNSHHK